MSNFHTTPFWYRGLDLIRHNIGTSLKHNKYMFDIPIPFCHNLYLSATEFACFEILFHVVYMWERTKFLRAIWLVNSTNQIARAAFTCIQQCWGKIIVLRWKNRDFENWVFLMQKLNWLKKRYFTDFGLMILHVNLFMSFQTQELWTLFLRMFIFFVLKK